MYHSIIVIKCITIADNTIWFQVGCMSMYVVSNGGIRIWMTWGQDLAKPTMGVFEMVLI
jgi:hypothetical protein